MAFTQARVAALRGPAGGWLQVYDETLPGLCLRVTPTGVKIFCVVKRVKGGRIVRVTLGRFPSLNVATYALKARVNHKQPQDDVTGGYLHLTPERLRKPAQQVEDKLLRMAGVKPRAEVVAFPTADAKET
jgi:hypothetical protein